MDAKRAYDQAPRDAAASARLGVCEASDWFWWPGDHNPGGAISDFDVLFRGHLRGLYQAIGETPPTVLDRPFSSGRSDDDSEAEIGGTMRRGA
jgi:hypothetical protein